MRRLALSVPQATQRRYIVRVNQAVTTQLKPSIPTSTARFKKTSLNDYIFPEDVFDNPAHGRIRAYMPRSLMSC